jgi:hypothetical protein
MIVRETESRENEEGGQERGERSEDLLYNPNPDPFPACISAALNWIISTKSFL